jgi:hypothetical protein
MEILRTVAELRAWSRENRSSGKSIGLVPTMGALHAGHASLIRAARESCGAVAVSIFVNPTQFGPNEDFARYPRSFEADCALAEAAGATMVFAPSVEELYPPGAATFVEVAALSDRLDGAVPAWAFSRSGHGCGQAADRRGAGSGVLRAEGRGAGCGAAPDGDGSAAASGDCGLPHCARGGRAGARHKSSAPRRPVPAGACVRASRSGLRGALCAVLGDHQRARERAARRGAAQQAQRGRVLLAASQGGSRKTTS